jgi:hypothetical protein
MMVKKLLLPILFVSISGFADQKANQCTDFSGTWKGSCSSGGGTEEEETLFVAQQGCESLLIEGKKYTLGSVDSMSNIDPITQILTMRSLEASWLNADRTILIVQDFGARKMLGASHNYAIESGTIKAEIRDGKLVMDQQLRSARETTTLNCSYSLD